MIAETRHGRRRVAHAYAEALYELAVQKGRLEIVCEQLRQLQMVFHKQPKLEKVLSTPTVKESDRQQIINSLTTHLDELVRDLLTVMNRRGRLHALEEAIHAFFDEHERRMGRISTLLTTAGPIDQPMMDRLRQTLAKVLDREPVIDHQIEPGIIGGFVAQAGELLIDASVRTQLAMALNQLLVRGEDEIQRRRDRFGNQT